MSDEFRIRIVGGQVGIGSRGATTVVSVPNPSSSDYLRKNVSSSFEGSLNLRQTRERNLYTKWVRGDAVASDFLHPVTLRFTQDQQSVQTDQFSFPPSWARDDVTGINQSFVIGPLSSSNHEVPSLNAHLSGSSSIEQTEVSAVVPEYYAKSDRFVHAIYKLSASAALIDAAAGNESFIPASGNFFVLATADAVLNDGDPPNGTYGLEASSASYRSFSIDVPEYGKIRNIRVWAEVLSLIDTPGTGSSSRQTPLGTFFLGLRSPNVSGFIGYVVWNDPVLKRRGGAFPAFTSSFGTGSVVGNVKSHWHNTFVLWSGQGTFQRSISTWGKDLHFRTIFDDGSQQHNGGHMDPLFALSGTDDGNHELRGIGSPTWKFQGFPANGVNPTGSGIPWLSDVRLAQNLYPTSYAAGSPPFGWLTGPGGTANVNEFATTGSNWGPETIRPFYPLLDNIIEVRPRVVLGKEGLEVNVDRNNPYIGFRPGLRGTEIHGRWDLVIGQDTDDSDTPRYGCYFRQFRLEFIYEKHEGGPDSSTRKYGKKFNRGNVAFVKSSSRRLICRNTGSTNNVFDTLPEIAVAGDSVDKPALTSEVFDANSHNFYGTTVGITDSTGTLVDYSVLTRITGALAEHLSGNTWWFLDNEFGTPYIPISSGSGEDPSVDLFTDVQVIKETVSDILDPKPLVTRALSLRSTLSRFDITKTTRDLVVESITGSI